MRKTWISPTANVSYKPSRRGLSNDLVLAVPAKYAGPSSGGSDRPQQIQHHRDAIHTLKKDLSLDDPDALTFHRDKLKEAQDGLDKLRKN